jgi:aminomuconate-semialdehyde/2-hydroxymuconate-6-semialdehyde dehydrogenase
MQTLKNYINGMFQNAVNQQVIEVFEPATAQVFATIPNSDKADVALAVAAAKAAFPSWSATSLEERHDFLIKISNAILSRLDEFAAAESRDNGKPIWLAKQVDIPRAAQNFKFFATAIMQFASESHEMPNEAINYTLRKPIGVVACISPWNLPLYLFTWKIAPALAAGNCVIAKPSEVTPYTSYLFSSICEEIGLPPGVLNILHGDGLSCGKAMVEQPEIKAISFTGSTRAGRDIAAIAAPMFKKISLELGGKNPVLIFDDCNYEEMLATTVQSSFRNQGQICLCGSRIYVEKSIYEKFKTDFVARVKALRVGDPNHADSQLGAIVSKVHFEKIMHHIELAKQEGGTLLCGGKSVQLEGRCSEGWFIEPTVFEGLSNNCQTNQEEIFGPVVTIQPFDNEEDALQKANDIEYGLAAVVWTENLRRAHRLATNLEAGIVWINCWMLRDLRTPFGGVKNSGIGREGGWEALRFFTETKNVTIKY